MPTIPFGFKKTYDEATYRGFWNTVVKYYLQRWIHQDYIHVKVFDPEKWCTVSIEQDGEVQYFRDDTHWGCRRAGPLYKFIEIGVDDDEYDRFWAEMARCIGKPWNSTGYWLNWWNRSMRNMGLDNLAYDANGNAFFCTELMSHCLNAAFYDRNNPEYKFIENTHCITPQELFDHLLDNKEGKYVLVQGSNPTTHNGLIRRQTQRMRTHGGHQSVWDNGMSQRSHSSGRRTRSDDDGGDHSIDMPDDTNDKGDERESGGFFSTFWTPAG